MSTSRADRFCLAIYGSDVVRPVARRRVRTAICGSWKPPTVSNASTPAGAATPDHVPPDRIIAAIDSSAKEFIMRPFNAHILIGKNDAAVPTGDGT